MALENIGLDWVNKGVGKFISDTAMADKTIAKVADSVAKAAQKINTQAGKKGIGSLGSSFSDLAKKARLGGKDIGKSLSKMGLGLDDLTRRFAQSIPGGANFVSMLSSIPIPAGIATAAIGAVIAGVTAFIALGVRGAGFQGIIDGFKDTGISLERLRVSAKNTIADIDLMKTANIALAGATGLVRKEFGEKLPKLLEIARAQARSTGQDVGFLFNSLVGGIKRSSPLLIDNTGLVLKVSQANEDYAQTIGKTVAQLTAQEKQVALLEATLESGRVAVEKSATAQETAGEKLARIGARIQNIFDRLAFAIQPVFEFILDQVDGFVAFIEDAVTRIVPYIQAIARLFAGLGRIIGDIVSFIITPIRNALQGVLDFIISQGKNFALGGARLMGSFVNAIAFVINNSLLPLIILAAKAIADLLIGNSPPPKGPLSVIDKGGANVMLAWMEGFAGVSIQPVEQVARNVTEAMGRIATYSTVQVAQRINQLDQAVQPFINQLDIVKARFDSIREPAEKALEAIDRQIEKFTQGVADGDASAVSIVRNLDARRKIISDQMESNQLIVDSAQVQLSLVQAQQSEERALLAIQQARLGSVKKTVDETVKGIATVSKANAGGAKATAEKKPTGTGTAELPSGIGEVDAPIDVNQFGENAGFIPDLDLGFVGELGAEFLGAIPEIETTTALMGDLQTQLGRFDSGIDTSGIGGRIADAFASLPSTLGSVFSDVVTKAKGFFFGEGEGSLQGLIQSLPSKIPELLISLPSVLGLHLLDPFDIGGKIRDFFLGDGTDSIQTTFNTLIADIPTWLTSLTGEGSLLDTHLLTPFSETVSGIADLLTGGGVDGLKNAFINMEDKLPYWLINLGTTLLEKLVNPFDLSIEGIVQFFTDTETEGTLAYTIKNLGTKFGEWTSTIGADINDSLFIPIANTVSNVISYFTNTEHEGGFAQKLSQFFSGDATVEQTLAWILSQGVVFIATLPNLIGDALSTLGTVFWNAFGVPIVNVLNFVIDRINDFLQFLQDSLGGLASIPGLEGLTATLSVRVQKISTDVPEFLGAEHGGIFGSGSLIVGERGQELMTTASSKTAVFPSKVTNALMNLDRVFAQPQAQHVFAGSGSGQQVDNSRSFDDSMLNNFYGMKNNKDLMQRLAINRMRGRRR